MALRPPRHPSLCSHTPCYLRKANILFEKLPLITNRCRCQPSAEEYAILTGACLQGRKLYITIGRLHPIHPRRPNLTAKESWSLALKNNVLENWLCHITLLRMGSKICFRMPHFHWPSQWNRCRLFLNHRQEWSAFASHIFWTLQLLRNNGDFCRGKEETTGQKYAIFGEALSAGFCPADCAQGLVEHVEYS